MNLPLRLGSRGDDVRRVQGILGEAQDGIYGEVTRAAVRTWQQARGLAADGVVGPATWARMQAEEKPLPGYAQGEGSAAGAVQVLPTAEVLRSLGWTDPAGWSVHLIRACQAHGITTKLRLAAFLANIGNETNGGRRLVESLDYTPEALMANFGQNPRKDGLPPRILLPQAIAFGRIDAKNRHLYPNVLPHAADQRAIGNQIYGGEWGRRNLGNTEPGDGYRFRGHGAMQTTGRRNLQRLADRLGRPLDDTFLAWLETMEGAAESAAFFFEDARMAEPADRGDIEAARRIANGGDIGMVEVKRRYQDALRVLG